LAARVGIPLACLLGGGNAKMPISPGGDDFVIGARSGKSPSPIRPLAWASGKTTDGRR